MKCRLEDNPYCDKNFQIEFETQFETLRNIKRKTSMSQSTALDLNAEI